MRYGLLSPVLLLLAGCTSTTTHELLSREIGRTIADVTLVAGPPQSSADLPDGRRAFHFQRPIARADGRAGLPLHGLCYAERPPAQPRRLGRRRRRPAAARAARRSWRKAEAQPATFPSTASQNIAAHVEPAEALHLADACRRGDVDLGQVIADHVDADEDEAAAPSAPGRSSRRSRARAWSARSARGGRRHACWSAPRPPPARG